MATLVLNKRSLSVKLESKHLVVHDHDDDTTQRVPLLDVERMIVIGQPAVTFPVLAALMDWGIPCMFLTPGGRWRGLMDGDPGFHADRRVRQYSLTENVSFSLRLSRQLIEAKLANSRRTIQRLASERRIPLDGDADWTSLSRLRDQVPGAETSDSLRGIEGAAAVSYFRLLGRFFPADAPFPYRSRRPPLDPANALLSFLYTLLTGTFMASIRSHGLDVACGFFHRLSDRSPALALDLMEPFRPVWGDRLALDLLNHRRVRAKEQFEPAVGGIHLTESGRRIVFQAFSEMMERRLTVKTDTITCRQLVDREVCRYIGMVEANADPYFYRYA